MEKGLGTCHHLNNVETYANVPTIIEKGAEWFRDIGVKGNGGTKVFSWSEGSETPLGGGALGSTVRRVVFEIGGGIINESSVQGRADRGP